MRAIGKHPGLTAALPAAVLVFVALQMRSNIVRLVLTWDAFAVVFLATAMIVILRSGHPDIKQRAARYDESDFIIVLVCLMAAGISLIGIIELVMGIAGFPPDMRQRRLALAIGTVAFSWFFLHTVLAVHYAHAYYWPKGGATGAHAGGLEFPGEEAPDYFDFLYFAFVLGATAQTSDVAITAKPMRRLAMLHGMLSFAFNTVRLALAVSVAATLLTAKE